MKVIEIGGRGLMFDFEEGETTLGQTIVYAIKGEKYIFLCDTQTGPKPMKLVKEYLKNELKHKKLIIFNSHYHWDHIWGNDYFENSIIVSHSKARENMIENAEDELKDNSKFVEGKINIKYPDITFDKKLTFEDEGVEFIYAPGHTSGHAICYDKKEKVVFVGDLVEEPMPMLLDKDLDAFRNSLEYLLTMDVKTYVTTHSYIATEDMVNLNLQYVKAVIDDKNTPERILKDYPKMEILDKFNRNNVMMLKYENILKNSNEDFDGEKFREKLWEEMKIDKSKYDNPVVMIASIDKDELEKKIKEKL
jgi:glyoxylase-like metal-dependent hydrolase (beta-lactamase superfamily II)